MIKPVSLLRLVSAAVLALPVLAHAAGLGRLTVSSYLGQPLQAQIDIVSLQPGEEASLEARLASGNAFAQAGIEFNAALNTMQFVVDKRGGRPVIVVSTRQPVNEPFLDLLVELRWSTGLFVREYTILLDPPGYEGPKPQPSAAAAAPAPAARAEAPPQPSAAPAAERAPTAPTTSEVAPAPRVEERPIQSAAEAPKPEAPKPEATEPRPRPKPEAAPAAPAAGEAAQAPQGPQTYEVKKGDTLGEIALRYRPAGVTYHQMLIALQRANEEAFIRGNINLVRAGRILAIPDAQNASAVDPADANRLVFAQHADFADYRSRLAGVVAAAPARQDAPEQRATGAITVQPGSPKPAAPSDQLKLSRADAKKPGAGSSRAAREDNLAASQRALQEAQSRVAELEKNVSDLKKLLEIRDQQLAQLQEKAAKPAPSAPPPSAAKPAATPKPAPATQVAKAPEAKPEAPKPPAEAPKPAVEAPKPAAAPAPVAEAPKPAIETPKPAAAPKPPAVAAAKPKPRPAAPPPPEPSFLEELLADPTTAMGGAGLLVALLGGYGYWAWQRKKKSVAKFKDSVLGTASLAPVAGAEAAAGGPASVAPVSVSQSAAGGVDADDVDPIAEADVYMAYGRDAQAEEILKEALQRDPNRLAVHSKLLEIYANRRDPQAFEQTALKLKGATGGTGPEWDKAMALGRSIDPANGLYGGAGETTPTPVPAFAAAAAAAPAVDFDIGGAPSEPTMTAAPAVDLDISGPSSTPQEKSDFSPGGTLIIDNEDTKAATSGLDFDLGGAGDTAPDTGAGLNFELPASAPAPAPAAAALAPSGAASSSGLDFDLNLGGGGDSKEASPPALDLSAISLDLGTPAESSAGGGGNGDAKWQEVATKLDLAKAYEEMGDKDGARELLNEVLREGDSAQQGQANQLLAKLG